MDEIDLGVITPSLKYLSNLWIIFNETEQFDFLAVLDNCKCLHSRIDIMHALEILKEKDEEMD